ncbi:MAG TPA: ABC transporter substrate-binding protein [Microvirga sp.]|jgi:putative ABC transport system substrate-binding protein
MKRRDVLFALGAVAMRTRPARAQQAAVPVVGYLSPEAPLPFASRVRAFCEGLAEAGFVEGRNVAIAFRWAEGQYARLPELAADLVASRVDMIVAPGGAPVALAAKAATSSIPIVFEMGGDPVAVGVVSNLSRPDGNITGVSSLSVEVSRKRLEFMRELLPGAGTFAVAINPTSPTVPSQLANLQSAADALGVQLRILHAGSEREFETAFAITAERRAGGLVFTSDPYFANRSQQLAALATRHGVPAVTQSRDFPVAGGLMSYGGDFTQSHRQAGVYTGRVLKGEKPAHLPVQQITKVELFLNLKAASQLGLVVPPSMISGADVIIE